MKGASSKGSVIDEQRQGEALNFVKYMIVERIRKLLQQKHKSNVYDS